VIISRTPFRVSLVGGGSDFREYYRDRPGAVVAMAINKYMYVTVNKRFDETIRVSYTKTEIVDTLDELQHDLIREAMRMVGVIGGIEVTTIADIPAGIGLGSSSTLTVGVLNALHAYASRHVSAEELAQKACEVEIEILKKPIGKQDQYLAAYGGFQHVRFQPDETVQVNPIIFSNGTRRKLIGELMLFYTGMERASASVLQEAKARINSNGHTKASLDELVRLSDCLRQMLYRNEVSELGQLLDRSWTLKKDMGSKVTNNILDRYYEIARSVGAEGGKILGAGGGGCLLLSVKEDKQAAVRTAMLETGLTEISFDCEPEGSKIIYVGG
jgi:D-glycero-alpha-D-manno-heptose-7-phosphate kinase